MKRGVNMGQAHEPLEQTYSRAEVMAHLGCKKSKLHELMTLGRKFAGRHPTKGGLWPWFSTSVQCVRITRSAIEAHKRHMERLATDTMFRCEMKAKARALNGHQEAA